jgi:hypothetical protein
MNTLLLTLDKWDLCVDALGNIAMASSSYALAQDAASACRTFLGEVYYDTGVGVPYWQSILGKPASLPFVRDALQKAAMSVQGVTAARVYLNTVEDRVLTGQVQITDVTGAAAVASFTAGGG